MSEALNEEALEVAAMAAIEAAEGAQSPDAATPAPDKAPDKAAPDPRAQIVAAATKAGWKEKDQFEGDPDKWSDAPEYILLAAGELLPTLKTKLDAARGEIKDLKAAVKTSIAHMSKADERAYNRARADLEADLAHYAEAGDKANAQAVADEMVALDRDMAARPKADDAPVSPEEFTKWREDNPWYGTDTAHTAACAALAQQAFDDGYSGKAQIAEVDRRMRETFPTLFAKPENPNRRLPGTVEGGGQARPRGGKAFSDMPPDAQAMCLDLVKLSNGKITKEGYVREHFAEETR